MHGDGHARTWRRQGRAATFGSLTIERRVLLTPSRTISIPNISTIATRTIYESNAKALVTLGLLLLSSGGLISLLTSSWGLALVGIAIVLFIAAASSGSSTNFLIITTNDGTRSLFSGPREETLEQVRRLLSDKINAHDETATYNINFETGTIESLNVAAIASSKPPPSSMAPTTKSSPTRPKPASAPRIQF